MRRGPVADALVRGGVRRRRDQPAGARPRCPLRQHRGKHGARDPCHPRPRSRRAGGRRRRGRALDAWRAVRDAHRRRLAGRGGRPGDRAHQLRRAVRRRTPGAKVGPSQPARRFPRGGNPASHRHSGRHPALMPDAPSIPVLVHADESCLGNDSTKPSPGGNAALIEAPAGDSIARWDFYEYSPQTTNNKMALAGAIATLEWIRRQWKHARVVYVSDSQYLVKGMTEWVQGWEARGWKRKGGALENQELWQKLVQAAAAHQIAWRWIEGHAGHAKNEYANDLAIRAAQRQERSNGLVPSGFDVWLAEQRARGAYRGYDPDRELDERL